MSGDVAVALHSFSDVAVALSLSGGVMLSLPLSGNVAVDDARFMSPDVE